jgi:DMSO reductase anchor subunit
LNPAWSVIVFTTLAGAAQGLVVVLALATLCGLAMSPVFVGSALWLALAMLVLGLGASFLHLGRPARAWRAAAMWRTSWLSREVIVLPAFTAVVALWALCTARGSAAPWPLALAALLLAALLWWCTAMIYACLRFIQEWAHALTLVNYSLIGLASGAVLAAALACVLGDDAVLRVLLPSALLATAAAAGTRMLALRRNARLKPKSTLQSATGMRSAHLAQMSMGMTGGAFALREFFHGRSARALRHVKWLFLLCAFALPALLLLLALAGGPRALVLLAAALQAPGLLAERWFFFAQARHPQNLYYQAVS